MLAQSTIRGGWVALAFGAVLSVSLGTFAAEVPGAAAVERVATDTSIKAQIETLYVVNNQLSPLDIKVTVQDGVVTLHGSVADEIQKDLAGDLAASTEGVSKVENEIIVVPAAASARQKRGWGQRVQDASVTASVRARLAYYKQLRGFKIGVETDSAVVTLYGTVPNEAVKEDAERIAFETRGVDRVVNQLVVSASAPADAVSTVGRKVSDEWLEKRVETSILFNRYISISTLDVECDDGACILTGLVDTPEQKKLAESIAENILGVNKVQNDIQVRSPGAPPSSEAQTLPAPDPMPPAEGIAGGASVSAAPAVKSEDIPAPSPSGAGDMEPIEPLEEEAVMDAGR